MSHIIPPRSKATYHSQQKYSSTLQNNTQNIYQHRQVRQNNLTSQNQKSSSVQKINEQDHHKNNGIIRANTSDKSKLEAGQQSNFINDNVDNNSTRPTLYRVCQQANPQFENFHRVIPENLKNHSFITQQARTQKPHSFKQLTQIQTNKISQLYYVGDLQNAIANQRGVCSELFREHIQLSFTYIPLIRNLDIDQEQVNQKLIQIPQDKTKKYNKTIVFDLDETLIHCNEDENDTCQFKIPIEFEDGEMIIAGINIRNFAKEIIHKLSDVCEVMIFTASQDIYANQVINLIDPHKKLTCRLFRDSCVNVGGSYLIKHLEVLNRELKNIVLIDNASYSFAQPSFRECDEKDNQLIKLYRYLCQHILPADDVRPLILQHFKQHKLNDFDCVEDAVQNLYF